MNFFKIKRQKTNFPKFKDDKRKLMYSLKTKSNTILTIILIDFTY